MDAARKAEAEAAAKLKEAEHKLRDVTQRDGRLHEVRASSATANWTLEHQPIGGICFFLQKVCACTWGYCLSWSGGTDFICSPVPPDSSTLLPL